VNWLDYYRHGRPAPLKPLQRARVPRAAATPQEPCYTVCARTRGRAPPCNDCRWRRKFWRASRRQTPLQTTGAWSRRTNTPRCNRRVGHSSNQCCISVQRRVPCGCTVPPLAASPARARSSSAPASVPVARRPRRPRGQCQQDASTRGPACHVCRALTCCSHCVGVAVAAQPVRRSDGSQARRRRCRHLNPLPPPPQQAVLAGAGYVRAQLVTRSW
jgi:hypothetical protein